MKLAQPLLANLKRSIDTIWPDQAAYIFAHLINTISQGDSATADIREVMKVVDLMDAKHIELDPYVFTQLLKLCGVAKDLTTGKKIHQRLVSSKTPINTHVYNTLISMYAKCGDLAAATTIFKSLNNSTTASVVTWNAIIAGFNQHDQPLKAYDFFTNMKQQGVVPSSATYASALTACAKLNDHALGIQVHAEVINKNVELTHTLWISLLQLYTQVGTFSEAKATFDGLRQAGKLTLEAFTQMIVACVRCDKARDGLNLYTEMKSSGIRPDTACYTAALMACIPPVALELGEGIHEDLIKHNISIDVPLANALLNMYAKCNHLVAARAIFDEYRSKRVQELWASMISGYGMHGNAAEALALFSEMQTEGIKPDAVTIGKCAFVN